ncbi:MAG: hypothetical protein ACXWV5_00995 [Flavitalea sp.]
MKGWLFAVGILCCWNVVKSQSIEDHAEFTAAREDETEMQETELLKNINKEKIFINDVDEQGLAQGLMILNVLSEKQIESFVQYRRRFGKLLSKYELQAIPDWDIQTIRKILPYLSFEHYENPGFNNIMNKGNSMFLVRNGGGVFREKDSSFAGAGNRLLLKYQYRYQKKMNVGFLAEKDAGEKMTSKNFQLFDFYSLHFEWNNLNRHIRKIVAGDYTVNFGQGLIQWQGFGFGKGGGIATVKKQGETINSYHGANEYNFHRGIASVTHYKNIDASVFISRRLLDGNFDGDSISSINVSGLHRTANEIQNRKSFTLITAGLNVGYKFRQGSVGLNSVVYKFEHAYSKRSLPYNIYAIREDQWRNLSLDYSYTFKNLHLFGELAIDKRNNPAIISGLILSLNKFADLNLVYRNISPGFQSLFSRALTENTAVNNESGLYMNCSVKWKKFLIDFYGDQFYFPWVKFTVDAPSSGWEYGLQLKWSPSRDIEFINRVRIEEKDQQVSGYSFTSKIFRNQKRSFRSHLNYTINKERVIKLRFETTAVTNAKEEKFQGGFLSYVELQNRISSVNIMVVARFQYFDTDDFESRIYAFERDVTYAMSVPFFTNKGWRYYFTIQGKPSGSVIRKLFKGHTINLSLKWSQSISRSISNNNLVKSDLNLQMIFFCNK